MLFGVLPLCPSLVLRLSLFAVSVLCCAVLLLSGSRPGGYHRLVECCSLGSVCALAPALLRFPLRRKMPLFTVSLSLPFWGPALPPFFCFFLCPHQASCACARSLCGALGPVPLLI